MSQISENVNTVEVFRSSEFGEVRTIVIGNKVWFVANDVAKSLGYTNPSKATNDHCRNAKKMWGNDSLGRQQEFKIIPEGDVYRLITRSKLPSAEKFESWVFDEVLPTIHKHGAYMSMETIERTLTSPDFLIQLATQLKEEKEQRARAEQTIEVQKLQIEEQGKEIKHKNRQIEIMLPDVQLAKDFKASDTSIEIGTFAKVMCNSGYKTGEKKLFQTLREDGYLIKSGKKKNQPIQKYINMRLFELDERVRKDKDGDSHIYTVTLITPKGQEYFFKKYTRGGVA